MHKDNSYFKKEIYNYCDKKDYIHFVREIYSYCDKNIGEKALFPVFTNLWNENGEYNPITKKDLAVLTSKIILRLLKRKVLKEIPKDEKSQNPYGLYKISFHKNLMRYDEFAQKESKLVL